MLPRTYLPLLRLRQPSPALRSVVSISQSRFYANTGKPQSPQPPWKEKASAASAKQREPLRKVRQRADENITAAAPLNDTHTSQTHEQGQPAAKQATPEQPNDTFETSSTDPVNATTGDAAPEPQPQQPLPDLTKGIPSTLAAELERAQSRQRSHKHSLNITEDPSEPTVGEDEGGARTSRSEYVSSSDRKKNAAVRYTYLFLALGGVAYAMYLGRNWETEELEQRHAEEAPSGWAVGLFFNRIKARMGSTMSYYNDPVTAKLLPDEEKDPNFRAPFTLVLSLEDMLIHQEWTRANGWRIAKRPGLDYFLRYLTQYYELVLFTSQPSASADQILRKLDPYMMIRWPLFREATLYKDGGYVKVRAGMTLSVDAHR